MFWGKIPYVLLVGIVVAYSSAYDAVVAGHAFYICCWGLTQLPIVYIKLIAGRRRPCAVPYRNGTGGLDKVKRTVVGKYMSLHLQLGRSAIESFPSGDAAGAGAFGAALVLITGNYMWLLATVLGSFGRVYFHAHHLLDVVFGASVGVVVTYSLNSAIPWQTFTWMHWLTVLVLFNGLYYGVICRKFRPPIPADLQTEGAHYHS